MASRTQLRLDQITGSFRVPGGGIVDDLGADSAADLKRITLVSGSMVGIMSEVVSSIKRMNGGDHFAAAAAGVFTQDTFKIQSENSADPLLIIENANTDAVAPRLRFNKTATGADNDILGAIEFQGDDEANNVTVYALISGSIVDASDGTEGGKLALGAASHNGTMETGLVIQDGNAAGELDIIIGSGPNSVTTIEGNLQVNGNIAGDADEAKSIFAESTSAGNGITLGGGADIVLGGNLKMATAGVIEDSGGHSRFTATDSGVTAIGAADGTAGITLAANNSLVTIAGDLTVSGNDLDFAAAAANIGASVGANNIILGGSDSTIVIPGNLQVTGSQTILDVTNTSIKDQLLIINSASNDAPIEQDTGIIFARPDISYAIFVDVSETGDPIRFVTTYTSGSATGTNALGTPVGDAPVTMGDLTVTGLSNSALTQNRIVIAGASGELNDDTKLQYNVTSDIFNINGTQFAVTASNGHVQSGRISIDSEANHLDIASTNLTATAAAKFIVDAVDNIRLDHGNNKSLSLFENGTQYATIAEDSRDTLVSASLGAITLDSPEGQLNFEKGGNFFTRLLLSQSAGPTQGGSILSSSEGFGIYTQNGAFELGKAGSLYASFNEDSNNLLISPNGDGEFDIIFKDGLDSDNEVFRIDGGLQALAMPTQNATGNSSDVGILSFNGNTDVAEAIYSDGTNLHLRSGGKNFKWPNTVGSNGQAIITDGNASNPTLSYQSISTPGDASKKVMIIAQSFVSGTLFNPNSSQVSTTAPSEKSDLNLSTTQGVNLQATIDVFVNGQLLVSGTDAQCGAGTADYFINQHQAASNLKFGFDLEVDDVVIVCKKA